MIGVATAMACIVLAGCDSDAPVSATDRLLVRMAEDSTAGSIPSSIRVRFTVTRGGQAVSGFPITVVSTDPRVIRDPQLDLTPPPGVIGLVVGPGKTRLIVSVQAGSEYAADTTVVTAR